jgi:hypothetical protein
VIAFSISQLAPRFFCQNTRYRTSVNWLIRATIFADLAVIIAEHNLVHLQHEFNLFHGSGCHGFSSQSPLLERDRMKPCNDG